ncbi:cytochrome c oxidase subunit II [Sphaerobacter sp.]|uniref:cytochrome c oxidase subunit II n=1 Tax=Sphaerobacter sp. TaxID=2099654 RepID=UPI001D476605|nr:cytochrome c oxidase subunit II [Sphaerobacter sp.]MBX5444420.1 cytochrome c oxidase subunit II [Sphaerobacter sp.]
MINRKTLLELGWILPSIAIPVGMLVAVIVSAFGMMIHVPSDEGTILPAAIDSTPPFDQPGVLRQVGPNQYEVAIVAQIWVFNPREIRVPAGAEVTFVATSRDVIHGLDIEGTNVNVMLIPGRITRQNAIFKEPGVYRFVCHEYCGAGHHLMFGQIIVEEP